METIYDDCTIIPLYIVDYITPLGLNVYKRNLEAIYKSNLE